MCAALYEQVSTVHVRRWLHSIHTTYKANIYMIQMERICDTVHIFTSSITNRIAYLSR